MACTRPSVFIAGYRGKPRNPWEVATLEWFSGFNRRMLLEPIGYIPPEEAEHITTGNLPVKPPRWRFDLNQPTSAKPDGILSY